MVRALLAALATLVLLLVPPPAGADVALLDDVRAVDAGLAGRDVLVARELRHARVVVDALNLDGAPRRRVFTMPSPGRGWDATVGLSASPQRVALLVLIDDEEGTTREYRLYSGPPSGAVTLTRRVRWRPRPAWVPVGLDVDADRLLLAELAVRDRRPRVQVLVPGAPPWTVPWPGAAQSPAAIAGERIAFVGSTEPGEAAPLDRILVADWHTGAVEATLDIGDPDRLDRDGGGVDLAADGRLVAAVDGRLLTVAPGVPQGAVPGEPVHSSPQFAGGQLVALAAGPRSTTRPVSVAFDGRSAALGPRSTQLDRLVADERGTAWIANGCVRYSALDGTTPAAPPAACPSAEAVLEGHDVAVRGRTLRIAVTCITAPATGCRGTVRLRAGGVRGRGRFAVPPDARRLVPVRLNRRGLRWVRAELRRYGEAELRIDARIRDGRQPLRYGRPFVLLTDDPELDVPG